MDQADEAQVLEQLHLSQALEAHRLQHACAPRASATCRRCGDPIPPDRLKAVTATAHCVDCARRLEFAARNVRKFFGVRA